MSESSGGSGAGILPELLTTLFVGLKLAGVIDWSWWWVCSPIFAQGAFILIFLAVWGVIALVTWRGKK